MGLIITPQAKVDAYYLSDALSQSTMKDLLKGFDAFMNKPEKKSSPGLLFGSIVDTILTGEPGQFNVDYYVSTLEAIPSEKERAIIHLVYEDALSDFENKVTEKIFVLSDYTGSIEKAILEVKWQPKWKMITKIEKIITIGSQYFEELVLSAGKTIISSEDKFKIEKVVQSLSKNANTAKYFDRDLYVNNDNIDIYYQLPIYFKHKGVDCKALLDMLIVIKDENGVPVKVEPIDLKTMAGYTVDFTNSVKKWRYDIQAAWYTLAVSAWLETQGMSCDIDNFKFVVESTIAPGLPLVFTCTDSLLQHGIEGTPEYRTEYSFRPAIHGYSQLMDEYTYYSEQGWRMDYRLDGSDGKLVIDWNGIVN